MRRIALVSLFMLSMLESRVLAQGGRFFGGIGTPQGNYLQGIGIASWGAGLFNLHSAAAYSITVDADIRLNKYLSSVFRAERDNYQKLLKQDKARKDAAYKSYKERVREQPNILDVTSGNALNVAFEQIGNPQIQESSRRSASILVPLDVVRQIPFKLDQKNQIFSVQRLTGRGKGKWPVIFQDDKFKGVREAYEKQMDKAMDQMIDRKMPEQTIKDYTIAVWDIRNQFIREFGDLNDTLGKEARARMRDMEAATELLKIQKVQAVMAGIDRYNGKTVEDLRQFMHDHNLKFAAADDFSEEERRMYVDLYEKIDQMRMIVVGAPGGKGR